MSDATLSLHELRALQQLLERLAGFAATPLETSAVRKIAAYIREAQEPIVWPDEG